MDTKRDQTSKRVDQLLSVGPNSGSSDSVLTRDGEALLEGNSVHVKVSHQTVKEAAITNTDYQSERSSVIASHDAVRRANTADKSDYSENVDEEKFVVLIVLVVLVH